MNLSKLLNICLLNVFLFCFAPTYGQNLKKYYYPVKKLKMTKVYHYECKEDKEEDQYWELTYDAEKKEIKTLIYDASYQKLEDFTERLEKDGSYAKSFFLVENKISKPTIIADSLVYHWKDTTSYTFKVHWPQEGQAPTLYKTRKFKKKKTIKIKGKKYKSIQFQDHFKFDIPEREEPYEFNEEAYYAKGIGLVKFVRTYPNQTRTHELKSLLKVEDWEKQKKK